jgi:predicted phosphodiesterase
MLWLRKLLFKPVLWLSNTVSSQPKKDKVFQSLSDLLTAIIGGETKKGLVIPFECKTGRFIIFSDQHKGAKNGADDFATNETTYLAALEYYYDQGFHFIAMGDCEELWENTILAVKKHQQPSFERERRFIPRNAFIKIFGNHDLYWSNDPFAPIQLKDIFKEPVPIHEGVVLQTTVSGKTLNIFCTHGHQGDLMSDGNWFSKFFVSKVWAPLQMVLKINPNTPAYDTQLKTLHNELMYEWSSQQENLLLITGHTHQPVFASMTHLERLYGQLLLARQQKDQDKIDALEKEIAVRKLEASRVAGQFTAVKPCYFNSGCCCYDDGDITGIEIDGGCIRLIKWHSKTGEHQRIILEESKLEDLLPAT